MSMSDNRTSNTTSTNTTSTTVSAIRTQREARRGSREDATDSLGLVPQLGDQPLGLRNGQPAADHHRRGRHLVATRQRSQGDSRARCDQPQPPVGLDREVECLAQDQPPAHPALVSEWRRRSCVAERLRRGQGAARGAAPPPRTDRARAGLAGPVAVPRRQALAARDRAPPGEYALRDANKPIGVAEYQLVHALPAQLETSLPSIAQLEHELKQPATATRRAKSRQAPARVAKPKGGRRPRHFGGPARLPDHEAVGHDPAAKWISVSPPLKRR